MVVARCLFWGLREEDFIQQRPLFMAFLRRVTTTADDRSYISAHAKHLREQNAAMTSVSPISTSAEGS